ncbi:MAG: hypothetical protein V5A47_09325 [Bacteroidales bacterium]|nr:hypothetical protein [Bacteroidales bacterium]MBS3774021.1 hypothetical protein [Bacteroidales bacterium]
MSKLSPDKYFKSLSKLYINLIFIQLVFILMALYLRTEQFVGHEFGDFEFFKIIVPLFAGVGIYEGNVLYKRRIKEARKKPTLAEKLADYRLGLILRYILWIAPSLFAIAAYFLTGTWIYLAISGLIILVFLINRPGMDKTKEDLGL